MDPTQTSSINKQRGQEKFSKLRIEVLNPENRPQKLAKPDWIRTRIISSEKIEQLKSVLRENRLHTVCEEAACPNLPECFGHGTATFMIMGDKCTRRCSFCDVAHGKPEPLDPKEPYHLAKTIQAMGLVYVVITSVDRDDLRDGGAQHFIDCISQTRRLSPHIKIEILVPDFRGRLEKALEILGQSLPDVFNHNIETVARLYKPVRPGSDYQHSLNLLKNFKQQHPTVMTKSGAMLGLGETMDEIKELLQDLRHHQVDMLTLGQYLQPSQYHHPVLRYVTPAEFDELGEYAKSIGFTHVASGPMVRSSYHADLQAAGSVVR